MARRLDIHARRFDNIVRLRWAGLTNYVIGSVFICGQTLLILRLADMENPLRLMENPLQ